MTYSRSSCTALEETEWAVIYKPGIFYQQTPFETPQWRLGSLAANPHSASGAEDGYTGKVHAE